MVNGQKLTEESLYIAINNTEKLHLKRFFNDKMGQPVVMLHGSIENGKIFYSSSGKGLAPFLADQGYDVFVPDFRGKGKSTPPIVKPFLLMSFIFFISSTKASSVLLPKSKGNSGFLKQNAKSLFSM